MHAAAGSASGGQVARLGRARGHRAPQAEGEEETHGRHETQLPLAGRRLAAGWRRLPKHCFHVNTVNSSIGRSQVLGNE